MCFAPQRRAIFGHVNFKKWSESVVFPHFDLQICFAPQRRAIFENRNVQNGSAPVVFSTFWLANVLFATAACKFLNIGTSKMAPRMWCFVHFDLQMCFAPQRRAIFHLSARTATSAPAALARLRFEHQQPRIIEKTQRFATSLTFFAHVELLATDSTRMFDLLATDSTRLLIFLLLTLHTCWSSCYWHDCCATLLFNSTYCRKLDF